MQLRIIATQAVFLLLHCPGIPAHALSEDESKACITQAIREQAKIYFAVYEALEKFDKKAKGIACRAKEAAIPKAKWAEIKQKIWSDKRFRNINPNAECNARATLLSYELDRMGFKSEKIILSGGVHAPLKRPDGYSVYEYPAHTANVVTIKDAGSEKKFVLDPMFTEDLVPVEEYTKMLACPGGPIPMHSVSAQTSEPAWKKTTKTKKDACVYHETFLESSRKLVEVNERVESKMGSGGMYGVMMNEQKPVLAADRASALEAHCQAIGREQRD